MKIIDIFLRFSFFLLTTLSVLLAPVAKGARSPEICISETSRFFFEKYGYTLENARSTAITFCRDGGSISCVSEAERILYQKFGHHTESAREWAVKYCAYGAPTSCLLASKDWFHSHLPSPTTHDEINNKVIRFCAGGGTIACVEKMKKHFFNNFSYTMEGAMKEALNFCSQGALN